MHVTDLDALGEGRRESELREPVAFAALVEGVVGNVPGLWGRVRGWMRQSGLLSDEPHG